ncbi:hypothetical protein AVEN_272382-1 [Araneus ventricosus]|uniref:Uncharacterized protein n=1 Tax=Araneus ventricosus TaxID=182803 RepID=A0A4Y2I1H7_ARAVE|nr:hypothetical protein AVEN_272382-1 [Araneus ventricosus]
MIFKEGIREKFMNNLKTESSSPGLASEILNDRGRYDSSSTETGVLVAHNRATARPLPKEVRTITGGGIQSPHNHFCAHRGSKFLLTYPAATHIHIFTEPLPP